MKYQCNNTFERPMFHYNMGEVIEQEEYNLLPKEYRKWFTQVGKPFHFYCQNICGEVGFSIDEWNKAFDEVKNSSKEIQNMVLNPPPCEEQCFACMTIVGETRLKNKINEHTR